MKKFLLAIILICVLIVNTLIVSAAPSLTSDQAKDLLIEAYQRFRMIQNGITDPAESKYLKKDYIKVNSKLQLCTIFEEKGDGSKYNDIELPEKLDYVPITDERFNTIEKCYDYLEEIYTDHWANLLIKKNYMQSTNKDSVESIRLSNGGKFYENQYNGENTATFELWENGIPMILYANSSMYYSKDLYEIGAFNLNGSEATLKVILTKLEFLRCDEKLPEGAVPKFPLYEGQQEAYYLIPFERTVTFLYTSKGWRISGGTFFEDMLNIDSNPTTGDPTAIAIPALTAAAVISLAVPVGIMRRRRRYA